jgi:tol-pal system protein YbgF
MNIRSLAPAAAFVLLAGCVSTSDVEKLQSQISDLQEQLAQTKRTTAVKEDVQNVNQRIADQTATLLKSNGTLVANVDKIQESINSSHGQIEQTNYRIDKLVTQVAQQQRDVDDIKAFIARQSAAAVQRPADQQAVGAPPNMPLSSGSEMTVAPTSGASEDPVQSYQSAYRDYQRGNYDLAVAGFRDYVSKHPGSELADNAAYWAGESLFSQKKYREAIEQFDSVVTRYPKSDKVAGALLKKGYAYLAVGEKSQAIVQFQYVVHEHPTSPEASLARQKLKSLGVETK